VLGIVIVNVCSMIESLYAYQGNGVKGNPDE
jgi:hypothetical protein